jgi:hypothetical protein
MDIVLFNNLRNLSVFIHDLFKFMSGKMVSKEAGRNGFDTSVTIHLDISTKFTFDWKSISILGKTRPSEVN